MKKVAVLVAGAVLTFMAVPALASAMVLAALLDAAPPAAAPGAATPAARLPPAMLIAYRRAATACPGLSWTVLAAIGTVESNNGQSRLPGVSSGHNPAGAAGPLQFEPATFT